MTFSWNKSHRNWATRSSRDYLGEPNRPSGVGGYFALVWAKGDWRYEREAENRGYPGRGCDGGLPCALSVELLVQPIHFVLRFRNKGNAIPSVQMRAQFDSLVL